MPFILDSNPSSTEAAQAEERRRVHHEAEVVVVGAGVLGCAVSVALANQGRSVILLEKSLKEPDRIVGELLQPGGVAALEALGLQDCLEGIDAIRVDGYDVIYYGEEVQIRYPENATDKHESNDEASDEDGKSSGKRRRPEGRSFHHGRFISQLRKKAMANSNITVFETTATDLVKCEHTGQVVGVQSTTKGGLDYFFGHLTIVADGYASKFRRELTSKAVVSRSKFWALELIDADLPLPNHGHVILGDGSPVLLYQIGTRETRALIDIPDRLASASTGNGGVKAHLRNVVLPSLPKRVQPSFAAALDSPDQRLRSMPNSWLPPSTNTRAGVILLGDAMNMRHPLTGGGMTVALNDAVLLAELLAPALLPRLDDTKLVRRQMRAFHWRRKGLTSVINILAQALYALFAADDAQLKALQLGCFRYFQMGGQCVDGPVGLLAGIIRQPAVLFYHFFSVALYSIWLYVTASSLWLAPVRLVASVGIFWKACLVIVPYIASELRT